MVTDRAENVIDEVAGIRANAFADLFLKEVFDVFGECDFHSSGIIIIRLPSKFKTEAVKTYQWNLSVDCGGTANPAGEKTREILGIG